MILGRTTNSIIVVQYQFVQKALLGGSAAADSAIEVNPNNWVTIRDGRARVLPLAGAACYPISIEVENGDRRDVFDSTPVDFGGNRIRVMPRTMASAFGYAGVTRISAASGIGKLTDGDITNALYPAPQSPIVSVPAGSISGSSGFLSGLFAIESGAGLGNSPGLVPPFTWVAAAGVFLGTGNGPTQPTNNAPILLPDFARAMTTGAAIAFLGCGEGVIRHTFAPGGPGVGWAAAHTLHKWYIDPISFLWVAGGDLVVGPGNTNGAVVEIEETINLQLPTWLTLIQDVADGSGNIPWTASITRGGR